MTENVSQRPRISTRSHLQQEGVRHQPSGNFAVSREEFVFEDEDNDAAAVSDDQVDEPGDTTAVENYAENADYYATLGLQRNPAPTDAQIRDAYHQLSLTFHPDKQPPELQNAAKDRFSAIQIAHDVLLDPQKRTVFDLLGAEGVRTQWSRGGSMGKGGEAEQQEIGIRALSKDEFRRWFLKTMQERERQELSRMVGSRISLTLGLNAQSVFQRERSLPTISLRTLGFSRFRLNANYKVPFPWKVGRQYLDSSESKSLEDDATAGKTASSMSLEDDEQQYFTIFAGVFGLLERPVQELQVRSEETGTTTSQLVLLPHILRTRNIRLGGATAFDIQGPAGTNTGISQFVRRCLENSQVGIEGTIFPIPTLSTTIARPIRLIADTQPLYVTAKSMIHRSLLALPPILEIDVRKRLASGKLGYFTWNSGTTSWPSNIAELMGSFLTKDSEMIEFIALEQSSCEIGFTAQSVSENSSDSEFLLKPIPAQPSYNIHITASPNMIPALSLTYSLNIFRQSPPTPIPLSSFSSTTYHPAPLLRLPTPSPPLCLTLNLSTDTSSYALSINGSRPLSSGLTYLGLRVSLNPSLGLSLSFTWSRLGQSLSVPVALCPIQRATIDAVLAAVAVPFAVYTAIELGVLRPRLRKEKEKILEGRRSEIERHVQHNKRAALDTVRLMEASVARRQEKERTKDGLVILQAKWVALTNSSKGRVAGAAANVTVPLAGMVSGGQLSLGRDLNKTQLMGWWDPAPLKGKMLRVSYLFGGKVHEVKVRDGEDLVCPKREHRVE
ncbi:MAG: hypothetical protein Q9227_004704 [Pyrenula ochraceoflavens]